MSEAVDAPSLRGWVMRKGHRARLSREDDKESKRGRARYSLSIGIAGGWRWRNEFYTRRQSFSSKSREQRGLLRHEEHETMYFDELLDEDELLEWDLWKEEPWDSSEDSWSWVSSPSSAKSSARDMLDFSLQSYSNKSKTTRWEQAQIAANRAAEEYSESIKHSACTATASKQKKVSEPEQRGVHVVRQPVIGQVLSSGVKLENTVLNGKTRFPDLHNAAMSFAGPANWTLDKPSCSRLKLAAPTRCGGRPGKHRRKQNLGRPAPPETRMMSAVEHLVHEKSDEYRAVTDYFVKTLSSNSEVEIAGLTRIQNSHVYSRFLEGGGNTVMFHGCKTSANEASILEKGFMVSCCRARGNGFGTWLAYNASYSNGGYVFRDKAGWSHIFVCVASHHHTVLDDMTMRVVGQDCAYPQWLLTYRVNC
mmetsp:Transcript_34067/g.77695  ORF Transcript_34067/g.77695 Transcript_34067/m.77695 type:complete len:421 (-) Transcript_34067:264-1526(-)